MAMESGVKTTKHYEQLILKKDQEWLRFNKTINNRLSDFAETLIKRMQEAELEEKDVRFVAYIKALNMWFKSIKNFGENDKNPKQQVVFCKEIMDKVKEYALLAAHKKISDETLCDLFYYHFPNERG